MLFTLGWAALLHVLPAAYGVRSEGYLRYPAPFPGFRPLILWANNRQESFQDSFHVLSAVFPHASAPVLLPLENRVDAWFGNLYVDRQGRVFREEGRYGNMAQLSPREVEELLSGRNALVYSDEATLEALLARLPVLRSVPNHLPFRKAEPADSESVWNALPEAGRRSSLLRFFLFAASLWAPGILIGNALAISSSLRFVLGWGVAWAALLAAGWVSAETGWGSPAGVFGLFSAGSLVAGGMRPALCRLSARPASWVLLAGLLLLSQGVAWFLVPFELRGDIWRYVQQGALLHRFGEWPRPFLGEEWRGSLVASYPFGLGILFWWCFALGAVPAEAPLAPGAGFSAAYACSRLALPFLNFLALGAAVGCAARRGPAAAVLAFLSVAALPSFRLKTYGGEYLLWSAVSLLLALLDPREGPPGPRRGVPLALLACALTLSKLEAFPLLLAVLTFHRLEVGGGSRFRRNAAFLGVGCLPAVGTFLLNGAEGLSNEVFRLSAAGDFSEWPGRLAVIVRGQAAALGTRYNAGLLLLVLLHLFLRSRRGEGSKALAAVGRTLLALLLYAAFFSGAFLFSNYPSLEAHVREFERLFHPAAFFAAYGIFQGRLEHGNDGGRKKPANGTDKGKIRGEPRASPPADFPLARTF